MLWRKDEEDGSVWSATPEPYFILSVDLLEHGWRWAADDLAEPENELPGGCASDVAAAKAAAEHCYREYRKARPNRA